MDEQAKRIREALLAERRAQITAQRAQRHESTCERQAELSAKQAQRREEITQEQLRRAAYSRSGSSAVSWHGKRPRLHARNALSSFLKSPQPPAIIHLGKEERLCLNPIVRSCTVRFAAPNRL